ncbi:MAG: hypothetical protein NVS1B1_02810 [Candidatus Limnocylindrales bacterium]
MRTPVALAVLVLVVTGAACAAPRAVTPTVRAIPTTSPEPASVVATPTAAPVVAATPTPTPSGSARYVAIGASDTVGVGATEPRTGSWPARIAARLTPAMYTNLGVSGSLAAQARTQQLQPAVDTGPTVVTIWLAVNDLNAGVTTEAYAETIRGLLQELVGRTQARIFIGNVPDLRAVPAYRTVDPTQLGARIDAYDRAIAAAAAPFPQRVFLVDLFTSSAELMSTGTVSTDGFHPSDAGYQLIADRFIAAMRAAGLGL